MIVFANCRASCLVVLTAIILGPTTVVSAGQSKLERFPAGDLTSRLYEATAPATLLRSNPEQVKAGFIEILRLLNIAESQQMDPALLLESALIRNGTDLARRQLTMQALLFAHQRARELSLFGAAPPEILLIWVFVGDEDSGYDHELGNLLLLPADEAASTLNSAEFTSYQKKVSAQLAALPPLADDVAREEAARERSVPEPAPVQPREQARQDPPAIVYESEPEPEVIVVEREIVAAPVVPYPPVVLPRLPVKPVPPVECPEKPVKERSTRVSRSTIVRPIDSSDGVIRSTKTTVRSAGDHEPCVEEEVE